MDGYIVLLVEEICLLEQMISRCFGIDDLGQYGLRWLKNNFLGFVSCLGTLISTLFLYEETSLLNNKISKLLYAYILLSLFATILSLSIFFLNA